MNELAVNEQTRALFFTRLIEDPTLAIILDAVITGDAPREELDISHQIRFEHMRRARQSASQTQIERTALLLTEYRDWKDAEDAEYSKANFVI